MERDVNRRTTPPAHIGTAEMSLAMWLRNGRAQKSLSLDDVARITKIQPRILERLEAGKLDGLPAEVFVRGFVRSFARCVGLDEAEALRRFAACATPASGSAKPAPPAARAMIEAMGDLAPNTRGKTPIVAAGPQLLREEPANLAASEPSIEITFGSFDESPIQEADVPVEITFAEPSEVITAAGDLPADGTNTVATPTNAVETVVVAPPPDIDLSADSSTPTSTPKKKRARRGSIATDGAATPKRRRSKVASGTPSEPTAVIAAEIDAEIAAEKLDSESTLEPVAAKRRRKPRGSVQPPIAEAVADSDAAAIAVEVVQIPTDMAERTVEADVDVKADVDALVDVAGEISAAKPLARRVEMIDDVAAIDDADAPFASALEFAAVTFDSSLIDNHEETTRFERSDDMQLSDDVVEQIESTWTPRMPSGPFPTAPTTMWRRSAAAPALVAVIDDADPDGAERTLEDRRGRESRRTFLPPILMDRDGDRSARQGGLTLAVIILLIAATLTLSYLMRRPSAGGDGVTQLDDTIHSIG